jgi:hypothetical protein
MRSDPEFVEIMRAYGEELESLTRCVYEEEYLDKEPAKVEV